MLPRIHTAVHLCEYVYVWLKHLVDGKTCRNKDSYKVFVQNEELCVFVNN